MRLSIPLLTILLLVLCAKSPSQRVPEPGTTLRVAIGGELAGEAVFLLEILNEDDPSPTMANATYDHRRSQRAWIFAVRKLSHQDGKTEFDVHCERVFGLLTHPVNVRTEFDTDVPLPRGSDLFSIIARQRQTLPHGALRVLVDPTGEIVKIDGLKDLQEAARAERERHGLQETAMTSLELGESDVVAFLEPLFPRLPPGGVLAAGATWKATSRLGSDDKFPEVTVEVTAGWSAVDTHAVYLEGARAADDTKARPVVRRRSIVSLEDGLPLSVDWELRLEQATVGGRGRTIIGSLRRLPPDFTERWVTELEKSQDIGRLLWEVQAHRGRAAPFVQKAMSLLGSSPELDLRILEAVSCAGSAGLQAVDGLLAFAEQPNPVLNRRRAIWAARAILEAPSATASSATPSRATDPTSDARARALPKLVGLLDDVEPQVRVESVRMIGSLGLAGRPALSAILERVESEDDPFVLGACAWAAASLGVDDPRFAKPLARALTMPDPEGAELILNATWALCILGKNAFAALEALTATLDTTDETTLANTLCALKALGPQAKSAVSKLKELRGRGSNAPWVAERVAETLSAIGE